MAAETAAVAPVAATPTDKCPVCGMFVFKYPDFLAQIIFTDGSHALFDGAKDMFKFVFNLKKYNAAKERSDIAAIYVTDYYSMAPIDSRTAWYVVGSDVFGPMGRELMPFQQETDAKEFMKDHSGKKLLRFDEVTPELIQGLE
ncbi:MAG: nitrous oxide reductase accessory protein NosL [Chlorobium sp.]|nr:nitrous oxide reductase accessory protein NosL [Chlorobium sp.]